jgi:hypothetical protein
MYLSYKFSIEILNACDFELIGIACADKDVTVEKKRAIKETNCRVGDTAVIEGEATVMIGKCPA